MQIRKLRDPERDTRYKALLAADDLLSVPLGLAQSISAGVAEALTELLQVCSTRTSKSVFVHKEKNSTVTSTQ